MMRVGRLAAALCVLAGGMAVQPAAAETIDNVRSLDMTVQGHVSQRCAMGSAVGTDLGELRGGRIAVATKMALDCNLPFMMSIRAQNGAIQHATTPQGQGGYSGSLPYRLKVELPVRRPDLELISKEFDGRSLLGGQAISSAGGIALDGLQLRLDVAGASGSAGLLAGNYGEVIEITITPN